MLDTLQRLSPDVKAPSRESGLMHPSSSVDQPEHLLAVYDQQLRGEAETPSAISVARFGPLRLVTFRGGRGFVTYRDLGAADERGVADLVAAAVDHFAANPAISRVEWKTRGHDAAPGLDDALRSYGFVAGETESIMIGRAEVLDVSVSLPRGVSVRRITQETDVRRMCVMDGAVFGDDEEQIEAIVDALLHRQSIDPLMELWVAEFEGEVIGAGRLEPVPDTDFAGLWGGSVAPEWRHQGIYRALTAARARSSLLRGHRLIHSDSTAHSRPILERAGLIGVSTTTPHVWRR